MIWGDDRQRTRRRRLRRPRAERRTLGEFVLGVLNESVAGARAEGRRWWPRPSTRWPTSASARLAGAASPSILESHRYCAEESRRIADAEAPGQDTRDGARQPVDARCKPPAGAGDVLTITTLQAIVLRMRTWRTANAGGQCKRADAPALFIMICGALVASGCGGDSVPRTADIGAGDSWPDLGSLACSDHATCGPARPICRGEACDGCQTGAECDRELGLPYCTLNGRCVECRTSADCGTPGTSCLAGACVECATGNDCPGLRPMCASGTCQDCTRPGCTDDQMARALQASTCAAAVRLAAADGATDDLEASLCCGRSPVGGLYAEAVHSLASGRRTMTHQDIARCYNSRSLEELGRCVELAEPAVTDANTCFHARDCTSQACDSDAQCPSTCAPRPSIPAGCTEDAECLLPTWGCVDGACALLPANGEPCNAGRCRAHHVCDEGLCAPYQSVYGPCGSTADCELDLRCAGGTCVAASAVGNACIGQEDCNVGSRCVQGTCTRPGVTGAPCIVESDCPPGDRCLEALCVAVRLPGDTCDSGRPCAHGLACLGGRCQPAPDIGQPCAPATPCLRGSCIAGVCADAPTASPCSGGLRVNDALDPCGSVHSCVDGQCVAESVAGTICVGVLGKPCAHPSASCNSLGVCVETCHE